MHHKYNNNTKRICQYKLIKYISTIVLTGLQEDNTIKQISTIVDKQDKSVWILVEYPLIISIPTPTITAFYA